MKPKLSKSIIQFREQLDDSFPDRDRSSDSGAYSDARHAARKFLTKKLLHPSLTGNGVNTKALTHITNMRISRFARMRTWMNRFSKKSL